MKPCTGMIVSTKFNNSTAPVQLVCSMDDRKCTFAVLQSSWPSPLFANVRRPLLCGGSRQLGEGVRAVQGGGEGPLA
eukprot:1327459-Prorocentrum_lima.AAC.1